MSAILNSLNAHNLPILQPILIILVSKFIVHRALSVKKYLSLGFLSPLKLVIERDDVHLAEMMPYHMQVEGGFACGFVVYSGPSLGS